MSENETHVIDNFYVYDDVGNEYGVDEIGTFVATFNTGDKTKSWRPSKVREFRLAEDGQPLNVISVEDGIFETVHNPQRLTRK